MAAPASARSGEQQVLDLTQIVLNGSAGPVIDQDGIQVVAFWGDASGDFAYSSYDAALLARHLADSAQGISSLPLLDPAIIGDVNRDHVLTIADVNQLLRAAAVRADSGLSAIPLPAQPPAISSLSPRLSLSQGLTANAGDQLTVSLNIDSLGALAGEGVLALDLAFYFDFSVLELTGVQLGTLLTTATGWQVATRVDALAGRVLVALAGSQPLSGTFAGELLRFQIQVAPDALPGRTMLNLAAFSKNPEHHGRINADRFGSGGPTDAPHDVGIDGELTIASTVPDPNVPTARLTGGKLLISGTPGQDYILVALLSPTEVRVRVNSTLLGTFAIPTQINTSDPIGQDFIYVSPELPRPNTQPRSIRGANDDESSGGEATDIADESWLQDLALLGYLADLSERR